MTERVTFFGEKGPEQGQRSQRLEVEGPQGRQILLAWTARPARPLADVFDTEGEYRDLVDELTARIQEQGGGVLAEVHPTSGTVRIHRRPGNGQGEIHQAIRLSPFDGASDFALTHEVDELQLKRGEHLLVPVSARAEVRMLQLRDLLGEMGPDVEALVLHTLRSPSLEARLGRLEEALELDRSGASRAHWWSRRGRRRAKAASQPVKMGVGGAARSRRRFGPLGLYLAVLLVVLLLVAGWFFLKPGRGPTGAGDVKPSPAAAATSEPGTAGREDGAGQPGAKGVGGEPGAKDGDGSGHHAPLKPTEPKGGSKQRASSGARR